MKQQELAPDFIEHLSEKPWSDYTKADYTIEQWHAACLIHQHDGPPTSKSQCKLPVKTPSGAINRNGVHAAAAALAGARGGVHASASEKASASTALIRFYRQMDEDLPTSLARHQMIFEKFLEHYGTRGMKWGVRKAHGDRSAFKKRARESAESKKVSELKKRKPSQLTNKQLKSANERMNLEQNYRRMNPTAVKKGQMAVKGLLATAGMAAGAYGLLKSPAGQAFINTGKKVLKSELLRKKAAQAASGQLTLPGL